MVKYLILFLLAASSVFAGGFLRQSTAVTIPVGPFTDDADGQTLLSAPAVTGMSLMITKADGVTVEVAALAASGTANDLVITTTTTVDCMGYQELQATDVSVLGNLTVVWYDADLIFPIKQTYTVIEEASYDALFVTAPGAAGGLFIAGTNAQTTITSGFGTDSIVPGSISTAAALKLFAGPNYANAVTEKDGAVEETSLSTTQTIYLTATANDAQFREGNAICFSDGTMYHVGVIDSYNSTTDVITLESATGAAPTNLTPIYVLGNTPTVEMAEQIVDLVGAATDTKATGVPVQAIASGTVQSITLSGSYAVRIYLENDESPTDGYYNNMWLVLHNAGQSDVYYKIAIYTGGTKEVQCSPVLVRVDYVTALTTTYDIVMNDPSGPEAANFGPNAAYAVLEKVGAEAGVSLSTTTAIFLTTNTYDDTLYAAGMTICFYGTDGLYHYGVIQDNISDALTLREAATGTPADGTPIYSYGSHFYSKEQVTDAIWQALVSDYNGEGTMGEAIESSLAILTELNSGMVTETISVITTGSSRTTLVLASAPAYLMDATYCKVLYYHPIGTASKDYSTHICTYHSGTTIQVFPPLTVDPDGSDTVTIVSDYGGLIKTDISGLLR